MEVQRIFLAHANIHERLKVDLGKKPRLPLIPDASFHSENLFTWQESPADSCSSAVDGSFFADAMEISRVLA